MIEPPRRIRPPGGFISTEDGGLYVRIPNARRGQELFLVLVSEPLTVRATPEGVVSEVHVWSEEGEYASSVPVGEREVKWLVEQFAMRVEVDEWLRPVARLLSIAS